MQSGDASGEIAPESGLSEADGGILQRRCEMFTSLKLEMIRRPLFWMFAILILVVTALAAEFPRRTSQ